MSTRDVAVVGMDCRFPGSSNYCEFWDNLLASSSGITEVPPERWDWRTVIGDPEVEPNKTNSKWGGFVTDIDCFDPLFFGMSPRQARYLDPQQRIALESAWHAIEDAGYAAPDLAGRKVGVYVGVSKNDYAELMREHRVPIPSFVSTGTVHSIIANRISFLLDLRARSAVVDTACSSSLVALHDAIRDLRLGECEMALVGGVNALLSPTMFIAHAQSGMLASDGRCKVFDARADGYVRGEGVAFVLLKPLARAVEDGDQVIGVIKGSAVNHGGRGNSLTTPSMHAQAEVVAAALADAAVDAGSIGYVEAHGTGTALGDPIEIRALTRAFSASGSPRGRATCPVGAVKTNIGHLESASGVAALIKVLLCLQHRQIPPSLHFERLNPYIELEGTPFCVVRERLEWNERNVAPRRAGLSAFGMGGVNAHVIVEEAPAAAGRSVPQPCPAAPRVIPLSAKTEAALERMRIQLRAFLGGPGAGLDIDDVAFTLQVGRETFPHRAAWVASGIDELAERLNLVEEPGIVFRGRAGQEPTVQVEETGTMSPAERARAWVQGHPVGWRDGARPSAGRRVSLPTYPFERQRCWFDEPMPASRANEAGTERSGALLAQGIYEVSGADYFVRDHVVAGRTIVPGIAYLEFVRSQAEARFGRSPMSFRDVHWLRALEVGEQPVALQIDWDEQEGGARFEVKLDGVVYVLGEVRFAAPDIRAVDAPPAPEHFRHTASSEELYERFAAYGLGYGPSLRVLESCRYGAEEAVCRIAGRERADELALEPSLLDGALQSAVALSLLGRRSSGEQFVPFALGALDVFGPLPRSANVHVTERDGVEGVREFDMVIRNDAGGVVARIDQLQKRPRATSVDEPTTRLELGTEWVDEPLALHGETVASVVLFSDDASLRAGLEHTFGTERIIGVRSGAPLHRLPGGDYIVDRRCEEQVAELFEELLERRVGHRIVLHGGMADDLADPGDLEALLAITKRATTFRRLGGIRVLHVRPHANGAPFEALSGGFARTLAYENPDVSVLSLTVEGQAGSSLAAVVADELTHYDHAPLREVAYRDGRRFARVVRALPAHWKEGASLFRPGGTYLVSGGAGGIGQVLSRHLARRYQAEIVLLGRSPQGSVIDATLAAIEALGGRARYLECDVSIDRDVDRVFQELARDGVTVNGIIHAAGRIDDAFIQRTSRESIRRVLAPKMRGALNLDEASRDLPLDFFLVFSSIAAVMPNQGQCAYAAANSFLDAFAERRRSLVEAGSRRGRSLAIAWPLWQNGGIKVTERERAHLIDAFGMRPMSDEAGIEVLEQCTRQCATSGPVPAHVIITDGSETKLRAHLAPRHGVWGVPSPSPRDRAGTILRQIIAGTPRGVGDYSADRSFSELGLGSLDLVALAARIGAAFRLEVNPTVFFEYPTPLALAAWLGEVSSPSASLIDVAESDLDASRFRKRLHTDAFFLRDHVVDGRFNVPGACFLELAVQAALLAEPGRVAVELTNNYWARPMSSSGEPIALEVRLTRRDDRFAYEIGSDSEGAWTVHAMGEVACHEPGDEAAIETPVVEPHATTWGQPRTVDDFYAQIRAEGLHVGPTFQPVVEAWVSQERAFTRLRLPEAIAQTVGDYTLHPTLLTGVLQTALLNNKPDGPDGTRFIPMGVDEIRSTGAIPSECAVLTRRRATNADGTGIAKFDAVVLRPDGTVVAEMTGVSLRRVDDGGSREPAAPNDRRVRARQAGEAAELERVATFLKELTCEGLGLSAAEIDSRADFGDFGIDSLMIVDLNRRLESAFGRLSKTLFFEYRNFRELAGYFIEAQAARLAALLPESEGLRDRREAGDDLATPAPAASGPREEAAAVHGDTVADRGELASIPADAVAIVGVGGRYPKSRDLDDFWQLLARGTDFIEEIPPERFDYRPLADGDRQRGLIYANRGSFLNDVDRFDPLFFRITPRDAERIDPQERLFLEVVWETLENAGQSPASIAERSKNVGVFVGVVWQPYVELGVERTKEGHPIAPSGYHYSIPNRVSYFFDWSGPSMAIDTACSGSLTAFHLACQSVARGDCTSAIAGGVNLSLTAGKYLFLSQQAFLSAEGLCRAFGANGDGYVPGEGVGAVYIERLRDAVHHGHRILAVVRATAINHGGKTSGYTVPNPNRQADLIAGALERGGVHPGTISYVEAHGTGTALGDPIEVTGLTKAFERFGPARRTCALGSIKSNIGHLETAAGIAGLTKVLLQLEHGMLVPSLHAETTNPNIDFDGSPFVVQKELAPWRRPVVETDGVPRQVPRRALVSSFGAGGSYAHAILEEPPEREEGVPRSTGAATPEKIVVLSARTEEQLHDSARRLRAHLLAKRAEGTAPSLRDVAYTLQVGREPLAHRAALVVDGMDELLEGLGRIAEGEAPLTPGFLGQAGSGETLSELIADDDVPRTVTRWLEQGKPELVAEYWVRGLVVTWKPCYGAARPCRVSLPTYPFQRDRYWLPTPQRSEPTSPVRSWSPHPLLHRNVSDLDRCAFESTFTGREFFLRDHVINGRPVLPAVVTAEMVRAAGASVGQRPVRRLVQLVWAHPVSVSADDVTIRLALSRGREGVAFEIRGGAIEPHCRGSLAYEGSTSSHGRLDYAALEDSCIEWASAENVYEALGSAGVVFGDSMRAICRLGLTATGALVRAQLPPVDRDDGPFELHPALFDAAFQAAGYLSVRHAEPGGPFVPFAAAEVELLAALPATVHVHLTRRSGNESGGRDPVLRYDVIIADEAGRPVAVIRDLGMRRIPTPGRETTSGDDARGYRVVVATSAWTERPLPDVSARTRPVRVFVSPELDRPLLRERLGAAGSEVDVLPASEFSVTAPLHRVLDVLRSELGTRESPRWLVIAAASDYSVLAPLAGLSRTLRLEHPGARLSVLGCDPAALPDGALADVVLREIDADLADVEVRYDHAARRRVKTWSEREIPRVEHGATSGLLRPAGTYWITGGAGGIARRLIPHLARFGQGTTFVLSGRSAPNAETQRAIAGAAANDVTVRYLPVDITDLDEVTRAVATIENDHGLLRGVVHAAGVLRDEFVIRSTPERIDAVLAPKVQGTRWIDEATRHAELDFFLLFSSIVGIAGNPGQGAYAAANAFLDGFAAHRQAETAAGRRTGRTLSIQWPLWEEGGMRPDAEYVERLRRRIGSGALPTGEGLRVLDALDALAGASEVLVAYGTPETVRAKLLETAAASRDAARPAPVADRSAEPHRGPVRGAGLKAQEKLVDELKDAVWELTKIDVKDLAVDASLSDYGLDSIILMRLADWINERYETDVTPTLFFEHSTLRTLSAYLQEHRRDAATPSDGVSPAVSAEDVAGEEPSAPAIPEPPGSAPVPPRTVIYTGDEPALRDHCHEGTPVLPGTVLLGVAASAFFEARPGDPVVSLREVAFRQMVKVRAEQSVELTVKAVVASPDSRRRHGTDFQVSGRLGDGSWATACTGRIEPSTKRARPVDLGELVHRLHEEPVRDELYTWLDGVEVGPSYRAVSRIHVGQHESLAYLRLPDDVRDARHANALHPTLLNCAVVALAPQVRERWGRVRWIPVSVDAFECVQTDVTSCWVWIEITQISAAGVRFDARFVGDDGTGIAHMEGFRLQSLPPAGIQETTSIDPQLEAPTPDPRARQRPAHSVSSPRTGTDERAIAIVGLDTRLADSPNPEAFWQNLIDGRRLVRDIPRDRFDVAPLYTAAPAPEGSTHCRWGSFIDGIDRFDAEFFGISPREADMMDPQLRLLLQSAYATAEDAGCAGSLRGSRTGVFVGACYYDYGERLRSLGRAADPHFGTGNSPSALANRVSFTFGLTGPSVAFDTACSSSLFALHAACRALRDGECEMAFVGGVNLIVTPFRYLYLSRLGALSPSGACHTFDEAADGYVPGEAVVTLLIKRLADAERDGDRILGVVRGSAAQHGGHTPSLTAPSVGGELDVLLRAWRDAEVDPASIGYIEAHGTGTRLGDPIEIEALKQAMAAHPSGSSVCYVGSAKAHVGHAEGAAGLVGVAKVLLQMRHGRIPAMPGFAELNSYIDLDGAPFEINQEVRTWEAKTGPRRAGISSFGFTGSYAHVVVEEYLERRDGRRATSIPPAHPMIVPLSARTASALSASALRLLSHFESTTGEAIQPGLDEIAHTLQAGREPMKHRAAFVVGSVAELCTRLRAFVEGSGLGGDTFRGDVRERGVLGGSDDEDLATLVHRWTERGELSKVAQLWVNGLELDWRLLRNGAEPRRVALPTYPFEPVRHWIDGDATAPSALDAAPADAAPLDAPPADAAPVDTVVADGEDLVHVLARRFAAAAEMPESHVDVHADISAYGLDSVIVASLAADLQDLIGVQDPALIYAARSIDELAHRIVRKYGAVPPGPVVAPRAPAEGARIDDTYRERDVAIIGLSGRFPQADGLFALYDNLAAGRHSIVEVLPGHFRRHGFDIGADTPVGRPRWGAFIDRVNEFDFETFTLPLRDAVAAHPEERLLLEEAWHCFESAGYDPCGWLDGDPGNIGVYVGASFHDYPFVIADASGGEHRLPYSSQTFTYANRLSYFFNLSGPSATLDTACSSSLYAISEAYRAVASGVCEMALAGGVTLNLHPSKYDFLEENGFLSGDGRCRSFAEGGTGYVPGEGVGLVLLKPLRSAIEDGDNVLGVIKGAAVGNDGRTHGFTVPSPDSQRDVIRRALESADAPPRSISFVECHGTGTALGDPIEISALSEAHGEVTKPACAISSIKANIGHLEAAAGVAQLAKTVLQLKHRMLFPNVMHAESLNPNIPFDQTRFRVQQSAAPWPSEPGGAPRRAGISSFGAGGTNVHVIVEEYRRMPEAPSGTGVCVLPLSADRPDELRMMVRDLHAFLATPRHHALSDGVDPRDVAGTLQRGRAARKCRLVVVSGMDMGDVLRALEECVRDLGSTRGDAHGPVTSYGVFRAPILKPLHEPLEITERWLRGETVDWSQVTPRYRTVFLPGYRFRRSIMALEAPSEVTADGALTDLDAIEVEIMTSLRRVLGGLAEGFDVHSELADFGIDSIQVSRIHADLSRRVPALDVFAIYEHNSVAKLTRHIARELGISIGSPSTSRSAEPPDAGEAGVRRVDPAEPVGLLDYASDAERLVSARDLVARHRELGAEHPLRILNVSACGGRTMEIVVAGRGRPLFLLPPFNSTAAIWSQQLLELADHFQMFAVHYPGLGASEWIDEMHSFEDLASVLTEVIDGLHDDGVLPNRRVDCVGWSFGGFLAQTMARFHPDHVGKLVLLSTTSISWSSDEYTISAEEFSRKAAQEFWDYQAKLPLLIRGLPKVTRLRDAGSIERFVLGTVERRVIDRYFLMIAKFPHHETARCLTGDIHLISGSDDELMPPRFARELASMIDGATYHEVPGGRHFLALFEKETINQMLVEWLGDSDARRDQNGRCPPGAES